MPHRQTRALLERYSERPKIHSSFEAGQLTTHIVVALFAT
jgi:hypothetical protein